MDHIASRQNPLVKRFRDAARDGGRNGVVLLDGAHLIEEALAAQVRIDVAAFDEASGSELEALRARAADAGTRVVMVSHQVLTAMSPVREPSGVVALAQLAPSPVERVSGRAPQLLVILVGVQDPGNVGALIRTAEACGATGMVTMNDTASPFGWKALRASMGSALRLPMAVHVEPRALLGDLRARGVRLVGTSAHGGTPLFSSSLTGPTAILLGAEGAGLPPELRTACDVTVTIPMKPPVESLNVATAGALLLFEAARQRSLRADS